MMSSIKRISVMIVTMLAVIVVGASAGYIQDAYASYKSGNVDEAIKICKAGLDAAPNDEELAFFLGQMLLKKKDYLGAEEAFKTTISLDPERDKAHYNLGYCYTKREPKPAWFEASQSFKEAVRLSPDSFKYLYFLGHSLIMQRKFNEAFEPLGKAYATEKGSNDFNTITDLGLVYQVQKNKDKALMMFEKAHALKPEKHAPLKYLGNLYMEKENYAKVITIGEELIQAKPDDANGYTFRGYGQLQAKNYNDALESFNKAIDLEGSNASAYFYRGLVNEGRIGGSANSYRSLINDYDKALKLSEGDAPGEWHYRLGHAYELEAMLDWDRVFRNKDAKERCLRNLAKARGEYKAAGDHSGAKKQLDVVNERIRQVEITG